LKYQKQRELTCNYLGRKKKEEGSSATNHLIDTRRTRRKMTQQYFQRYDDKTGLTTGKGCMHQQLFKFKY
jgi:hypothetical protein